MCGVQCDEAEFARHHAFHHGFDPRVILIFLSHMTPEDKDIGGIQRGVIESLFRRIKFRRFHRQSGQGREMGGDGVAEKLVAITLSLFRLLFIPHQDADGMRLGSSHGIGGENEGKADESVHGR